MVSFKSLHSKRSRQRKKSEHPISTPCLSIWIPTPFPHRLIVSSNKAPTERISAFVDLQQKLLVVELPSYIRNTKDVPVQLQSISTLPHDAILFTMDVVGLYSNISHDDHDPCCTLLDRRSDQQLPIGDIINLARMVLKLDAFAYRDDHFLEVHGTAMATRYLPAAIICLGCGHTAARISR